MIRSGSSASMYLSAGSETGSPAAGTCRGTQPLTASHGCLHAYAWKPGRCPDSPAATLATMSAAVASAASGVS